MVLTDETVRRRQSDIARSPNLQRLRGRLLTFLEPVLDGSIPPIPGKARLSTRGGACPDDGTRLQFDPLSPSTHVCPMCGSAVTGAEHDATWRWWYHLWLSERILQLGLLARLTGEPALADRGAQLLRDYADHYATLPNRDNVLGPTRVFFSTYLESIWLAQLSVAADLCASPSEPDDRVRRMIAESARLIREFDEGWSNRQVWNNTAMIAAGLFLGDAALIEHAVAGRHGIVAQLATAVTDDGLWFEGENYHFFALRGMQLAAELIRCTERDLYADAVMGPKLERMYVTPIHTLYPDRTVPARGDAPFGVSIAQPRFAELWEVGWARTSDPRIEHVLADLYATEYSHTEDRGFVEIAEHEVHRPPGKVTRDQLGWRALLWMRVESPALRRLPNEPVRVLDHAGVTIVRPTPDTYVSVDTGGDRGGHGHPDMLQANLFLGDPVCVDPGTGSYVDASLHWYRGALAHNGPSVAELGQLNHTGACQAADAADGWGWCRAVGHDVLGLGSRVQRTVVVGGDVIVDSVEVDVSDDTMVVLPIHLRGGVAQMDDPLRLKACEGGASVALLPRPRETISRAEGLGPPNLALGPGEPEPFVLRRAEGSGTWRQVYARRGVGLDQVEWVHGELRVRCSAGDIGIRLADSGVTIREASGREIVLDGRRDHTHTPPRPRPRPRRVLAVPRLDDVPAPEEWLARIPSQYVHALGIDHYRQSEMPYDASRSVRARAAVAVTRHAVVFAVDVVKEDLVFRGADDANPRLDNEQADIHSDGVQCYVGRDAWSGVLGVPDRNSHDVRCVSLNTNAPAVPEFSGQWCTTSQGYAVVMACVFESPLDQGERFPVEFVVNEMYSNRERRAGQLVLSGGRGWVYLRGDRESPVRALDAEVV